MRKLFAVALLGASLATFPMLTGCDDRGTTTEHDKTTVQPNGSTSTSKTKTTETPNGTTTHTETHTNP